MSSLSLFRIIDPLGDPDAGDLSTNVFYYTRFRRKGDLADTRTYPFRISVNATEIHFLYNDHSRGAEDRIFSIDYLDIDLASSAKEVFGPSFTNDLPPADVEGGLYYDVREVGLLAKEWRIHPYRPIQPSELPAVVLKLFFLDFISVCLRNPSGDVVFSRSEHHPAIRSALLADPSILGIYLKQVFILNKILKDKVGKMGKGSSHGHSIDIEHFKETRKEWIRYITDTAYSGCFAKNSSDSRVSWLGVEEVELKAALRAGNVQGMEADLEKDITGFYLRRYSIFKAFSFAMIRSTGFKGGNTGLIILWLLFIGCFTCFLSWLLHRSNLSIFSGILFTVTFIGIALGLMLIAASFKRSFRFNLLLPKMQLAILTSMSGFLSSYDFFRLRFDTDFSLRTIIILSMLIVIVATYLHLEVKKNTGLTIGDGSKFRDFARIIGKAFSVLVIGFIFSLITGLFGISLMAKDHITRTGFVSEPSVRSNIYELEKRYEKADSINAIYDNYRDTLLFATETERIKRNLEVLYKSKKANDSELHIYDANYLYSNLDTLHLSEKRGRQVVKRGRLAYVLDLPFGIDIRILLFPGFLVLTAMLGLFGGILLTLLFANRQITEAI